MRYVFVEIFELFWLTPKTPERPKNDPKIVKTAIFSDFYRFYAIFVKFSIDFVALYVEREKCPYPRGIFKEINATFQRKMPQIAIEIEKTSKNFGLLPFLCNFCQIFDNIASLGS